MDMIATLVARQASDPLTPGTPALEPPPGVTSDFNAYSSKAHRILSVNIVGIILAVIFMVIRLYTRIKVTRLLGADDYAAMAALVFVLAFSGLILDCYSIGLGQHLWNVPSITFYEGRFFLIEALIEMFYYLAICGVKLSILLLYLRIFTTSKYLRWFIYFFMTFLVLYNAAGFISNLVACKPIDAYWHAVLNYKAYCFDIWRLNISLRTFNALTDILIVTIPIPIVLRLHAKLSQRLGILTIFLTGLLAVACALVSLYYTIINGNFVADVTDHISDVFFWLSLELYVGFFCSCMPAFKPILQKILPTLLKSYASYSGFGSSRNRPHPAVARGRRAVIGDFTEDSKNTGISSNDSRFNDANYLELAGSQRGLVPATESAPAVPSEKDNGITKTDRVDVDTAPNKGEVVHQNRWNAT
ncbi:MAG: hypothetical protein M1838_005810 [Thelocarpon superellum]|nr:MAG: hypothetical protein M1838_005810 [Thelocarpon superellum]